MFSVAAARFPLITVRCSDYSLEGGNSGRQNAHALWCFVTKPHFFTGGNKRFRQAITNSLDQYRRASAAGSRSEKAMIVQRIISGVQNSGGRFLKENQATGEWYPLSEQQTKEKVSHAVRDAANTMDARKAQRASKAKKVEESKQDAFPMDPSLRSSLSSANLGSGNFYENLDRATREIRRQASQQNYFPLGLDTTMRGPGLAGFAEERLPIRTVRDIQIPGEHQQLMRSVSGHPTRIVLPGFMSNPSIGQYHGTQLHTNLVSEPRIGGLPYALPPRRDTRATMMIPEGPRLGFASFQAPRAPRSPRQSTVSQQQPQPAAPQPIDLQNSDDSDNFLDRINDVLGPMPDERDRA